MKFKLKLKFPYVTVILVTFTAIVYFLLSGFKMYIPIDVLSGFGFFWENPLALISYAFVHISPVHLFGNLVSLFLVGTIAEQKLRLKDSKEEA